MTPSGSPADPLAALLYEVSVLAYGQRRWAQAPWPTDLYDWVAARLREAGVVTKAEVVAAVEGVERHACEPCDPDPDGWMIDRAATLAAIDRLGETA